MKSIEEIIRGGETQEVEFKSSPSELEKGLSALCAMLNTDKATGSVYFGVSDRGEVLGIQGNLDTLQKTLSRTVYENFDPPLTVSIEVIGIDQKKIVSVLGTRFGDIPYHEYDGKAYIRQGTESRVLYYSEKLRLSAKRKSPENLIRIKKGAVPTEIYNRRFRIFEKAREIIDHVCSELGKGKFDTQIVNGFRFVIDDSALLFDEDIHKLLDTLHRNIFEYGTVKYLRDQSSRVAADTSEYERELDSLGSFFRKLQIELRSHFEPYLKLSGGA